MTAGCAATGTSGGTASTSVPMTQPVDSVVTSTGPTTSATVSDPDLGDLQDWEFRPVSVNGEEFVLAWADEAAERVQGLRGVDQFGELDGMMFDLEQTQQVSFTMRDTIVPLDIIIFDEAGVEVDRLEMVPCVEEPCPTYTPGGPVRYAIEFPGGSQRLDEPAVLDLG